MESSKSEDEASELPVKVKSVASTILTEFFDTLGKEEGFGEVALRLRKAVLEEGVFAEPSIRSALFPDAT